MALHVIEQAKEGALAFSFCIDHKLYVANAGWAAVHKDYCALFSYMGQVFDSATGLEVLHC